MSQRLQKFVPVVDPDPNTTEPDAVRVLTLARSPTGTLRYLWLASEGGSAVVSIWMRTAAGAGKWLPLAKTAGAGPGSWTLSNTAIDVLGPFPAAADYFVQVTAVGGATDVQVGTLDP